MGKKNKAIVRTRRELFHNVIPTFIIFNDYHDCIEYKYGINLEHMILF